MKISKKKKSIRVLQREPYELKKQEARVEFVLYSVQINLDLHSSQNIKRRQPQTSFIIWQSGGIPKDNVESLPTTIFIQKVTQNIVNITQNIVNIFLRIPLGEINTKPICNIIPSD